MDIIKLLLLLNALKKKKKKMGKNKTDKNDPITELIVNQYTALADACASINLNIKQDKLYEDFRGSDEDGQYVYVKNIATGRESERFYYSYH
jgi:hypothetical protein